MKIYLATQIQINDSQDLSLTKQWKQERLLSYVYLKSERERDLLSKYRWDRLISFYYLEQGLITLEEIKDDNSNEDI